LPAEQSDAEDVKRDVQAEGREALLIPGDLTDPEFCQRAVDETVKQFGQLDILVNNAAYQETRERLEDIPRPTGI
jgi:NAD(P)-dependent dehydrogenase (short-subunit alcohol dehydrogenase family)